MKKTKTSVVDDAVRQHALEVLQEHRSDNHHVRGVIMFEYYGKNIHGYLREGDLVEVYGTLIPLSELNVIGYYGISKK